MKRATLERLAAVLVLAACICTECIPLLLALVGAAGLCAGLANCQAIVNFRKGGFSMYYKICPSGAAPPDPGERGDCQDEKRPARCCEHRAAHTEMSNRTISASIVQAGKGGCQAQ